MPRITQALSAPTATKTAAPYRSILKSLNGIKALAVIGIIFGHMSIGGSWDMCARMVEILFILSGFCMAYNHYQDTAKKTEKTGWEIVKSKLPKFYPVHITTFLLQAIFVPTWASKSIGFILVFGALNLSLQQAWFQKTQFMFNNVSWFLSSLIFCYFITPSLKKLCRYSEEKDKLWLCFLSLLGIRIYLEYTIMHYSTYVFMDLHTNPIIQSLNYALGFIAGIYFIRPSQINRYFSTPTDKWQISMLECVMIGVYASFCYSYGVELYRIFYVVLALPIIYLLGFGNGMMSRLLSIKPLMWFEKINLELFMFHSFILYYLPVESGNIWYYAKFWIISIIVAIGFKMIWNKMISYISARRPAQ